MVSREKDAAHAFFAGINRSDEARVVRNNFGQAGRSSHEILGQCFKVGDVIPHVLCYADSVLVASLEGELEGGEEAATAWDSCRHEAEFTDDAFPLLPANACPATERVEDVVESLLPVLGHFNCLSDGVNNPSKDYLSCVPGAVTFEQFLERHCFLAEGVSGVGLGKDVINSVEEDSPHNVSSALRTLAEGDEVVHEHVNVRERVLDGL